MEVLNGKQLKEIAHKSHTATVVATMLAIRDRLRPESDITRTRNALIRQGEMIVESDYMQFWKDLQTAGVGSIIYGRKNKPDRFMWNFSLKKVAAAMIEGKDLEAARASKEAKTKKEAKPNAPPKTIVRKAKTLSKEEKQDKVEHAGSLETRGEKLVFIPLRPGFEIEIKVPSDFSKDEADVIAKAVARMVI